MLPFMLNNSVETKQSKLYTEFYKGFLLALKDVNERYNDNEINVYTYDTEGTTDKLMSILSIDEVKEMDLIFAPDVLEQLDIDKSELGDDCKSCIGSELEAK